MNLKEAIAGSVEKWRKLLAGEMALFDAFQYCSLCYYGMGPGVNDDMCQRCPLLLSGNGCLELDSHFSIMSAARNEGDIDHPSIRPHAEAMYAALLDIQRAHEEDGS